MENVCSTLACLRRARAFQPFIPSRPNADRLLPPTSALVIKGGADLKLGPHPSPGPRLKVCVVILLISGVPEIQEKLGGGTKKNSTSVRSKIRWIARRPLLHRRAALLLALASEAASRAFR